LVTFWYIGIYSVAAGPLVLKWVRPILID
jgi:hypothetical protein